MLSWPKSLTLQQTAITLIWSNGGLLPLIAFKTVYIQKAYVDNLADVHHGFLAPQAYLCSTSLTEYYPDLVSDILYCH